MDYLIKLRRGTRYVDDNGNTLLKNDNTPVRDDWATYTEQAGHTDPQPGELVVEFEYNPATGKRIPRLKIGDGVSTFAELEYISVDSFILPKQMTVTLYGSEDAEYAELHPWIAETDENTGAFLGRYKQVVTVNNAVVTPNSKVDLNPTPAQLAVFHEKDVAFVAENDGGTVTVYCIGQKPKNTYIDIPVTITEVANNE